MLHKVSNSLKNEMVLTFTTLDDKKDSHPSSGDINHLHVILRGELPLSDHRCTDPALAALLLGYVKPRAEYASWRRNIRPILWNLCTVDCLWKLAHGMLAPNLTAQRQTRIQTHHVHLPSGVGVVE